MKKHLLKKKLFEKGMTMTELLVSITLVGIISSVSFLSYHRIEKEFALQRSAYKLSQDIRRAMEKTMGAEKVGENIFPSGYGIYFEKNGHVFTVFLYADGKAGNENENYDEGEEIETISLEKGVKIQEVKIDSASPQRISINFKAPLPKIKISGPGEAEKDNATITICLESDQTKTKKIYVNKAGLIYVE